ncbi:MAG: DNA-binding protein [Bacteroidetes bacterium]|nr:MAG: DNA-binding protein [Bacteroidota bacterium]
MNSSDKDKLVAHRIEKAKSTLHEINLLVDNQLWNTAINRLYYACYYAVTALLAQRDIDAQTHRGVRQMFGLHFIKSKLLSNDVGRFYSDIFDKRQSGDYDDFVEFTRDDVVSLIAPATKLIQQIEKQMALK